MADEEPRRANGMLEQLRRQMALLDEKLGPLISDSTLSSILEVLRWRFGVEYVSPGVRIFRNGGSIELDLFACSDSTGRIFIGQVTERPRAESLERLRAILKQARELLPEHREKTLYGFLVVIGEMPSQELREQVLAEGIYLARIHDGQFEIQVPESFEPRAY